MLSAFQPQGNSQLVVATTAPSAAIQLSTGSIIGARLDTDSAVFFAYASSSSVQCAIPTTAIPANGVHIPTPSVETLTLAPNAWLSFATSGGTANVRITPGFGV